MLDQQAIETLLGLAETYGGHGKNLSQQGAGTVKGAHTDDALTTAEADLRVCCRIYRREQSHADSDQDSYRTLCQFNFH